MILLTLQLKNCSSVAMLEQTLSGKVSPEPRMGWQYYFLSLGGMAAYAVVTFCAYALQVMLLDDPSKDSDASWGKFTSMENSALWAQLRSACFMAGTGAWMLYWFNQEEN